MTSDLGDNLIHRVNVGDSLTRSAARFGDRTAMVDGARRWTYAEMNAWVNRIAHELLRRGYARGDALALAAGNSAEFLAVYYACAKTGVVCVPLNLGWREREMTYVLDHSEARGIVLEAGLAQAVAHSVTASPAVRDVFLVQGQSTSADLDDLATAFPERNTDSLEEITHNGEVDEPQVVVGDRDAITYLYTSGTTSAPKGVVGNHTAVYLESLTMAYEARFDEHDRFIAMLPMFHTAQLNCHCTPAIMAGATLYIERSFDPDRVLDLIESERITQLFGLPMMYRGLVERSDIGERDFSSLRRALYAMAPMPRPLLERCLDVFDCDFYLLFGQTEMSPTATLFRPEHQLSHNGAAGTPVVNVQVAIMNDDGTLQPTGGSGEIVYRGPHTMTEYLKNAAATAAAFEHGWFHSGDMGRFDEDGLLWFEDRKKDVIKTGGENVASIEVEKALYAADPNVAEVVVVGLPHDRWSEAITAVVVPRAGTTLDVEALLARVKEHIDPYKVPKSVIVVDDLPRTSTGKIQKNVLREQHKDFYARG